VPAEQAGTDHGTVLHAQILRDADHIHIRFQEMPDLGQVKRTQPVQKLQDLRFLLIQIHQGIHIAPDVAELLEGMTVAQITVGHQSHGFLFRHFRFKIFPVDGPQAGASFRVREPIARIPGHVRQRMPVNRAHDTIHKGFPSAAEIIHIGLPCPGYIVVFRYQRQRRPLKIRKQEGMFFHQIQKGILVIVIPAGGIDMECHGDVFRFFKPDGPQQIVPAAGRGGNIHKLYSFSLSAVLSFQNPQGKGQIQPFPGILQINIQQ